MGNASRGWNLFLKGLGEKNIRGVACLFAKQLGCYFCLEHVTSAWQLLCPLQSANSFQALFCL